MTDRAIHQLGKQLELSQYINRASTLFAANIETDLIDGQPTPRQPHNDRISIMKRKNKLFICTICSFECAWLYDLKQHQRKKHCLHIKNPDKKN